MKIEKDSLEQNYISCTRPELSDTIKEVLAPFKMVIKERKLVCKLHLMTTIPTSFYIEKKIYCEILYNLF